METRIIRRNTRRLCPCNQPLHVSSNDNSSKKYLLHSSRRWRHRSVKYQKHSEIIPQKHFGSMVSTWNSVACKACKLQRSRSLDILRKVEGRLNGQTKQMHSQGPLQCHTKMMSIFSRYAYMFSSVHFRTLICYCPLSLIIV